MTWDNFSAIMKLFFVLLLLGIDISFRVKGKYKKHTFSDWFSKNLVGRTVNNILILSSLKQ